MFNNYLHLISVCINNIGFKYISLFVYRNGMTNTICDNDFLHGSHKKICLWISLIVIDYKLQLIHVEVNIYIQLHIDYIKNETGENRKKSVFPSNCTYLQITSFNSDQFHMTINLSFSLSLDWIHFIISIGVVHQFYEIKIAEKYIWKIY